MKKMFNVLVLLVAFVGILSAFEPNHKNDWIFKAPKEKYAVVKTNEGNKESIISPDFNGAYLIYEYKNTGSETEKYINEKYAFYEETATAEEYILKIYKYLSEVPGYWYFYDMTEEQVAKDCDYKIKNGQVWQVDYKDMMIIKGDSKGTFLIKFKK